MKQQAKSVVDTLLTADSFKRSVSLDGVIPQVSLQGNVLGVARVLWDGDPWCFAFLPCCSGLTKLGLPVSTEDVQQLMQLGGVDKTGEGGMKYDEFVK
jgi:hypothetical protein